MGAQTGHILVVEDDATIAEIISALLEGEGYRVTVGVDGDAVPKALADPPDLVLLDVEMPGLDGPAVCRLLKADPRTRRTPVAFVTATPDHLLGERLAGCEYEAVIPKPFGMPDLLGTVGRLLDA